MSDMIRKDEMAIIAHQNSSPNTMVSLIRKGATLLCYNTGLAGTAETLVEENGLEREDAFLITCAARIYLKDRT